MRRAVGPTHLAGTVLVLLVGLTGCYAPGGGSATVSPSLAPAAFAISGVATAGPVCPVERNPPDPNCRPRPVAGAVMIIKDASGAEVTRATTRGDGTFTVSLTTGSYTLVPQPVRGLMGTPQPMAFQVGGGKAEPPLEVQYDTGIR